MFRKFYVFCLCSPVEEGVESLVNVTVTSIKSTEPSINDFQDFVSDMQKTITSLRKQVSVCTSTHTLRDTHLCAFVALTTSQCL